MRPPPRAALVGAADYDRLAEGQLDRYPAGLGVEVLLYTPPVISSSNTVHARQRAGKLAADPEELSEITSREGYGIGKKHRTGAIALGLDFDSAQFNNYLSYAHQEQP